MIRLSTRFKRSQDCIIGGRTVNALHDNVYSTASQLLISYLFAYYNVHPEEAKFLTGSNLAVPTDRFRACGGFDKIFYLMGTEEREFCDRWLQSGLRMVYAPEVLVYHFHALTLRSFVRQHFKYGCGAYHFHRLRSVKKLPEIKVEPFSFYLNMFRYPFSKERKRRAILLALLLFLSQAANAMGFFWEKLKQARKQSWSLRVPGLREKQ